jgi:hypothetical protein
MMQVEKRRRDREQLIASVMTRQRDEQVDVRQHEMLQIIRTNSTLHEEEAAAADTLLLKQEKGIMSLRKQQHAMDRGRRLQIAEHKDRSTEILQILSRSASLHPQEEEEEEKNDAVVIINKRVSFNANSSSRPLLLENGKIASGRSLLLLANSSGSSSRPTDKLALDTSPNDSRALVISRDVESQIAYS